MSAYRLLFLGFAMLSFALGLGAEPTPAKRAVTARRGSSDAGRTGHYIQLGACRRALHRYDL